VPDVIHALVQDADDVEAFPSLSIEDHVGADLVPMDFLWRISKRAAKGRIGHQLVERLMDCRQISICLLQTPTRICVPPDLSQIRASAP
jgi:hypothetical protein